MLALVMKMAYIPPAMSIRPEIRRNHWAVAALVVLLLGVQMLQAGHLHADEGMAADCVQCQVDGSQAMAISDAVTPPCLPAADNSHPDIAAAPVATFYRLSARGPPIYSS